MWKESAESEGYNSRASESEGRRETEIVDVHHLGAEKSGATKPGQRRVFGYATIWGAKLVAAAMRRVNGGDRGRTAGQGEGVGRRPSNVHCVVERLAGPANEEGKRGVAEGASASHIPEEREFSNMPGLRECRSMTDPIIRTQPSLMGSLRAASCIRPSSRLSYVDCSNEQSPYGTSLPS